MLMALKLSRLF